MGDDSATFYIYLKRKYRLNDDDIEEYIDSFNIINSGEEISPKALRDFINEEAEDQWSISECKDTIIQINKQLNSNTSMNLDLPTYLLYIIPICCNYAIARIGIREMFDTLDSDHDNKITCKELSSLMYKINRQFSQTELESYRKQIDKLCINADTNGDGYISYEEFKKFIFDRGIIPGYKPKLPEVKKYPGSTVPNYGSSSRPKISFTSDFYDEPVKPARIRNKFKHLSVPINPKAHFDNKNSPRLQRSKSSTEEASSKIEEKPNYISNESKLLVPKINDELLMAMRKSC
jgi:Ca2+-binding EF-hand superfamily protein